MRTLLTFLATLLASTSCWPAPGKAGEGPTPAERADALRRHGLDPATPLASRVGATPASVLKMFDEAGAPAPRAHELTEAERRKLRAAFEALPPLHRRILGERLRTVSFLDGMPNTALTSAVNADEPYRLFDITIRAGILGETASEWLTWKERTCFDVGDSPLSVSVEAGGLDAVAYVLLHEATHVVDDCLRLTPEGAAERRGAGEPRPTAFTEGVWADRLTPSPPYRDPLLDRTRYRPGGRVLPIGQAEALYAALRRTPFASLYGSANCHDDLAEYVALYHLTEVLGQPYRIVLRERDRPILAYEPFKSDLVRGRAGQMKRFYEVGP
ncbi:hypothetical protein OJF2_76980 [Aquisphaera giovannonii]|uniref:Secreted protein n=1 Tax=Aquisphaera giovannonii TaxID=406548 RepID=A0A5B9WEK2_9BACT|nr:hypothetical protein [Aquisphaera giovannonii]QEH39086.1 hypothetical protein OJF2_76980 [Aquisphaera giovannonii]